MNARRGLFIHIAVCAGLFVIGYLFFVLTGAGQASDDAGYFGRLSPPAELARIDGELLAQVRVPVIAGAGLAFVTLGLMFRRPVAGIAAALAMGVAIEGAEQFKHHLPRPALVEPTGIEPGYFHGDTYPSGHTSTGTSFVLGLLLILPPKWRRFGAPVAAVVSASFATAVFFLGWHRPSDALGGLAWTGLCFGIAALVLSLWARPRERHDHHHPHRIARIAGAVCLSSTVFAAAGGMFLHGTIVFALFTAAVVSGAFWLSLGLSRTTGRAGV